MQTRIAIIAIAGILVGLGIGFFFVNQSSDSTNEQSSNISTQVNTIAMPTSVVVNPPVVATAQITPTPNTPILVTPTVAAPVATPTVTATPEPTATPDQASTLVTNIADLVDEFGYPPNTDFAVLRIPSLDVSARVGEKIVSRSSATMPTPQGPADVVWYNMSEWPGLGGRPGEGGNAIFAGHVDYAAYVKHAQVNYFGMAVFGSVSRLTIGDIIEVDYEGNTYTYRVRSTRQYDADYNQWGSVWSDEVSVDSITLYTCGGEFDRTTRSYSDRFVVRAERI